MTRVMCHLAGRVARVSGVQQKMGYQRQEASPFVSVPGEGCGSAP